VLNLLIKAVDRAADIAGIIPAALVTEKLIAHAERSAGRALGDRSVEGALTRLLRAYEEEANLSIFGAAAARWDILRCLINLIRFEKEEADDPQILHRVIEKPIFVTGLPRSGTTFLHSLAAMDPANRAPLCWQTICPYPPLRSAKGSDNRRNRVAVQLRTFERLTPGIGQLHPLSADAPQECTDITAQIFESLRFDTTHHIPSYQRWLEAKGHLDAYCFHKRFLQHLQSQSGAGQWFLKCPDHVFAFDAIDAVYPDARFVFVHRDPLSVLPSVAKLTALLRAPFTRGLDRLQIGRQVSGRWVQGARLIVERCRRWDGARDRIFHVHYEDLTAKPLDVMAALYDRFGLELRDAARGQMRDFLERTPRGGYGNNRYSFEEFGLEREELQQHFADYVRLFDVAGRKPSYGEDQAMGVA
jgi:hypothetical protein